MAPTPDTIPSEAGPRTDFLGIGFDTPDAIEVGRWLAARDAASRYAYVVTPNVDHMIRLADAPEDVRRAYAAADLVLCDSRVLARLAQMAGTRLSVVPGSDLTATLFRDLLRAGDRVCLVGGAAGDDARLRALYPGVEVVQHRPPMGLRTDAAARARAIAAAVAARGRITLFAVGSPQQELLAHEMATDPAARGTALCIGASVEFVTGRKARAPRWMQRLGIEWLHRLSSDSRRLWRRYLVEGPRIFAMVLDRDKRRG